VRSVNEAFPRPGQLVSLGPYRGEHGVALRAGISIGIPLLLLWRVGHLDLALYAAFGSFAAIFGRTVPLGPRLRMQAVVGGTLVLSVLLDTTIGLSGLRAFLVIPVAAAWAPMVAILAHRERWHPPGALFQVFALGACSSIPATRSDLGLAAALSVGAALLALLVTLIAGIGSRLLGRRSRPDPAPPVVPVLPEWRLRHYLARYSLGIVIAGGLATALGVVGHPYWAMVAVVVPMAAPDTPGRLTRAAHRLLGTLLGVLAAWIVLSIGLPAPALIGFAVVMQIGAELFVGRNYGVALLFVTPLALSMVQLAHPLPVAGLVRDRALETLLGVVVAAVISLLTHERRQDADG
jgi:hypothetical protein